MFIHRRRGWEVPERQATPEAAVAGRRGVIAGVLAAGVASPAAAQFNLFSAKAPPQMASRKPLEAPRNARYDAGRPISGEQDASTYNNYYEFGLSKSVYDQAKALVESPWNIAITGMVAKPRTIGFEDLMKQVKLEERVYRHRCVEAWAMTVPWVGFPLADLVKLAEPQSSAKYMVFTTLADPKTMPSLKQSWYPWPYTEGVTMEEAMNELAFLTVGMYGKAVPPQNGAPIRLTLPWKYGFKSAKSIVKVEFTDKRPVSFWEALQDSEYGFWANVNPAVPHPRWSQAKERLLGNRRDGGDADLERLRRVRGRDVHRQEERAAIRLSARPPILPRVLAVLAALCLVGAFALALFYPPTMPLQRLVAQFDQQLLLTAQEWVREHWGDGSGRPFSSRCWCGRAGWFRWPARSSSPAWP